MQRSIPLVFTTDNAPALVAAMRKEGWFRMCCFAHVTALAINAANKVAAIKKWKQSVTNIVGHFKHSSQHLKALLDLRKEKGKKELKPIQEGATRWTSTFKMLDRFAELREDIMQIGSSHFIEAITSNIPRSKAMADEMLEVLDIYKKILSPFRDMTLASQGSSYPTLPVVARFLLPILCAKSGHVLAESRSDGPLQAQVKTKMLNKYLDYYGPE